MATKQDKALQESMSRRRDPALSRAQMEGTPFGEFAAQVKDTLLIPIESIYVSPFQSRIERTEETTEDDDRIADLVATIEREGLLNPVLVRIVLPGSETAATGRRLLDIVKSEGKRLPQCGTSDESAECHTVAPNCGDPASPQYELIAGEGRTRAHIILGRKTIPAKVLRMTDIEAARALTVDNLVRRSMTDWELYRHIQMLRSTGAATTQKELGSMLGCSRAMVYKLEAFGRLPAAVHAILNKRPALLGASQITDLHTKGLIDANPDAVIEAVEKVAEGKILQSGMVSYIERKLSPPTKTVRREFQLTQGKAKIKIVLQDGEARITGDVDEDELHALLQQNINRLLPKNITNSEGTS
ncbi:ParB/RepB/Spo0J family partition protein [Robbsia andropogonis]|uniref:ParB/RepB/Spo0J family partition protein n=1 Tax=Robbsia andropogonis TaxID=28092 RepID=UPI002A6B5278|nr:ParB/RepB/Spo0J family partition protein [Robbsia andropogonis]